MNNYITREKDDPFTLKRQEDLDYALEKNRLEKTKIIIKESEWKSVERIINKFKDKTVMELKTIFKLYKLQNYKYCPKYLEGTPYKYGSIFMFRSRIKFFTKECLDNNKNSIGIFNNASERTIYEFINEINSFSKPFPYIFDKENRDIDDLIDSGTLTDDEINFIKSKIVTDRPEATKEEREKRGINNMRNERRTYTQFLTESQKKNYDIIVKNYTLDTDKLNELVPTFASTTVSLYQRYCRHLADSGITEEYKNKYPKGLLDSWQSLNIHPKTQTSLINENSNNDLKIYAVISSSKEIKKVSTSLDYVKGYKEALNDEQYKLYRLDLTEIK